MIEFFLLLRYDNVGYFITAIKLGGNHNMYSFNNDYSEGAHPRILQALLTANLVQHDGYSMDSQNTAHAKELIKKEIGRNDADIHWIVGGTQANLITIAAALRPYQAVICAHTGHINVHETGAIEATGHKVIAMTSADGKLTPAMVQEALSMHTDEHMVQMCIRDSYNIDIWHVFHPIL